MSTASGIGFIAFYFLAIVFSYGLVKGGEALVNRIS